MSGNNGHHAPSEFPPPVDPVKEFVKRGLDDEDELIEVGVAIVGGGTAGLSCANRLLQLLGDDPELLEKLGEVPVAVIEKAKTCGGHNLSGAVMRPGPLQELFGDMSREDWRKQRFAFGEVTKESIYALPNSKMKLPVPLFAVPNFHNKGNEVVSVAAMARFQQAQAEEAGAYVLTETSATQLIVEDGRVVGVRSGDKGRGKDGEPLGNFEPGTDIKARVTVLAEGCWGHLTGAAIKEFNLGDGREPQVWELGVKEVWKVKKPLDRVIHTIGPWPLKIPAKYGHVGGTWLYPMKDEKTGDDLVSIGFVVDLDYADATTSAHDLLQQFKLHPLVKGILEGGERISWGAKALPGGGYWSMPKLTMPGALLVGDAGGMVDAAALKGVHHCIKSGILAGEAIYQSLKSGTGLESYEQAIEDSSNTLSQVKHHRLSASSRSSGLNPSGDAKSGEPSFQLTHSHYKDSVFGERSDERQGTVPMFCYLLMPRTFGVDPMDFRGNCTLPSRSPIVAIPALFSVSPHRLIERTRHALWVPDDVEVEDRCSLEHRRAWRR